MSMSDKVKAVFASPSRDNSAALAAVLITGDTPMDALMRLLIGLWLNLLTKIEPVVEVEQWNEVLKDGKRLNGKALYSRLMGSDEDRPSLGCRIWPESGSFPYYLMLSVREQCFFSADGGCGQSFRDTDSMYGRRNDEGRTLEDAPIAPSTTSHLIDVRCDELKIPRVASAHLCPAHAAAFWSAIKAVRIPIHGEVAMKVSAARKTPIVEALDYAAQLAFSTSAVRVITEREHEDKTILPFLLPDFYRSNGGRKPKAIQGMYS